MTRPAGACIISDDMPPPACRLFLALFAAASLIHTRVGAAEPVATMDLLTTCRDPLLIESIYRHPTRIVSGVSESGAVSVNGDWEKGKRADWFIEQQRYGGDLVQAGVVLKEPDLIRKGIEIIRWGFSKQATDGSFPGTGDPLHSVELFIESASRAALLLREAKLDDFEPFVAEIVPKLRLAALWMIEPQVATPGRDKNLLPFTHRFFIRAAALAQTARLTGEERLSQAAAALAREGITHQQPDGIDPERGGFDASYQVVGVLMAGRYEVFCDDPALRAELKNFIIRASDHELTKIDPAGHIDLLDSTRVTKETGRSGKAKTFDYKALAQSAAVASEITGDTRYTGVARQAMIACGWLPAAHDTASVR